MRKSRRPLYLKIAVLILAVVIVVSMVITGASSPLSRSSPLPFT